jgi:hypothetical protein
VRRRRARPVSTLADLAASPATPVNVLALSNPCRPVGPRQLADGAQLGSSPSARAEIARSRSLVRKPFLTP